MKCGNCEKNIPDGSKFCMYCGSEVQVGLTCHYCGFMGIPSGAFFCPACGAPLRREANVALDTLKIGDYYYSDGTFSSHLDKSKTCVGVVFSLETTGIEKAHGWTHGQIVALEDAEDECGSCVWGTDGDGFEAFKMARCYSVSLPTCTSGWYLPSLGQWRDILTNLGKITVTDDVFSFDLVKTLENLCFLNIQSTDYWSSTAKDASNSWGVSFFYYGRVYSFNRQSACRVRTVAAI